MHEPPGRYDVIIRVARDGGQLPDPVTFAVAADQAASRRSASIISVHMADTIINVVTVTAPGRHAALAVARAVVSDALKLQAPSPTPLGSHAPPWPPLSDGGTPVIIENRVTAVPVTVNDPPRTTADRVSRRAL